MVLELKIHLKREQNPFCVFVRMGGTLGLYVTQIVLFVT